MNAENQPISVSEMLRTTGTNTSEFMSKVAEHIEKLEATIAELQDTLSKLENAQEKQ